METLVEALTQENVVFRERIFTPLITLWTSPRSSAGTIPAATPSTDSSLISPLAAAARDPETGVCKARRRLPLSA